MHRSRMANKSYTLPAVQVDGHLGRTRAAQCYMCIDCMHLNKLPKKGNRKLLMHGRK